MLETLIGGVPDSRLVTTLGDLCRAGGGDIQTGPFGSQLHAADYVPVGIPSVMPQNIGDNVIVENGIARITESDAARLARYLLRAGDIVYSRRGDVERRALVREGQDGWLCGTGCLRVRLGTSANQRFISYYLGHPRVREWIVRHAIGATMPNLNTAILSSLPVVLPSMPEQDAIAEVLGAFDDKIEVNATVALNARQLVRFHYVQAVEKSNSIRAIGEVAEVFDGPHATPTKTAAGPWFLSISSLREGELHLGESAHLSEDDYAKWTRRVTPMAGDVLFSYETRLGEAALMPPGVRACLGRRMALLRPKVGPFGPRIMLRAFLDQRFQLTIRERAVRGATVDRIPLTELPSWPIALPEGDLERLEGTLGYYDDMANARDRENEALTRLRDTLLQGLMSGEIRVRDAEKVVEDAT